MKKYLRTESIILLALAVLALAGLLFSISLPAQVQSKTTRDNWEHSGKFDYTAYLSPSYLLGPPPAPSTAPTPTPTPIPQSALKYPAGQVTTFSFSFDYKLTAEPTPDNITHQIVVSASAQQNKEVVTFELLPVQTVGGSSSRTTFFLSPDNLTGDITVNIAVYPVIELPQGPLYESFTQTITLKREGSLFVIKRDDLVKQQAGRLGGLLFKQEGLADFKAVLKTGSGLFIEVTPPPVPAEVIAVPPAVPLKAVKPDEVIYTKLLNNIDAAFRYQLKSSHPITNLKEEVTVVAILEAVKSWSKTMVLVPPTQQTGSFSVPFSIDLQRYTELIESIRNETGVAAESYQLVIRADVHVTGRTDYGNLDEVFSPTLTTVLNKDTLTWTEKMSQTKPGSIETLDTVPNTRHYLGLSRVELKILTACLFGLFVLASLFSIWWFRRHKTLVLPSAGQEVRQYQKKYSQQMVEGSAQNRSDPSSIIQLNSMEDLIKTADQLEKPVIHYKPAAPSEPHVYQVMDGTLAYQFVLSAGQAETGDQAQETE